MKKHWIRNLKDAEWYVNRMAEEQEKRLAEIEALQRQHKRHIEKLQRQYERHDAKITKDLISTDGWVSVGREWSARQITAAKAGKKVTYKSRLH